MNMPQGSRWFTVQEVAQQFQVHIQTVRRLIRRGDIEAIKFGGEFRISEKALYEYTERQKQRQGERAAQGESPQAGRARPDSSITHRTQKVLAAIC